MQDRKIDDKKDLKLFIQVLVWTIVSIALSFVIVELCYSDERARIRKGQAYFRALCNPYPYRMYNNYYEYYESFYPRGERLCPMTRRYKSYTKTYGTYYREYKKSKRMSRNYGKRHSLR